jgi:hypothetical protein
VAGPPELTPGSIHGAQFVVRARFAETIAGIPYGRVTRTAAPTCSLAMPSSPTAASLESAAAMQPLSSAHLKVGFGKVEVRRDLPQYKVADRLRGSSLTEPIHQH